MGVKSACCIGCCVTIAIVAMLVGINGLMRYRSTELDHEETAAYDVPGNCTLEGYFHRVARTSSGDDCNIWRYLLTVGPVTPGEPALGSRVAYSNFFPNRCDGVRYNSSNVGDQIPCWLRSADTELVRVSPVLAADEFYLQVGAGALAVSGVIFVAFVIYNIVLWLGVCADIGPFSQQNVRRREEAAAAIAAERARREEEELGGPAVAAGVPGAFVRESVTVADRSWISDMALHNAYAMAVVRRFGHGDDLASAAREPTAESIHVEGAEEMAHRTPAHSEPIEPEDEHDGEVAVPVSVGTAVVGVTKGGDNDDSDDATREAECCVCWEPLTAEAIVFPCFHVACFGCVERLARGASQRTDQLLNCPMCRRQAFPAELRRLLRVAPAQPDAVAEEAEVPRPVESAETAGASPPGVPSESDDV